MSPPMPTPMSTPLSDLNNVNKHYINALEAAGVDTVEKLCSMTMKELGKIRGFGGTGLCEIRRALDEMRLKLREG